jgi:hypothetical protein
MIMPVAVAIVATVVTATAAVPNGSDSNVRIATVVARTESIPITRIVEAATRLDDGRRLRAVIRIAPGAATNVAGVVVTARERQGCRKSEK